MFEANRLLGTARRADGALVANGGRVLAVGGLGSTLRAARGSAFRQQLGALHDLNGDGHPEVVAIAVGHVKAFDGATGAQVRSFFAYDPAFRGGVIVAAGDLDGDGILDAVTAQGEREATLTLIADEVTRAQYPWEFALTIGKLLGFLLALLAFGPAGFGAAVALFSASNLIHFSLGARITSA